MTTNNTLDEVKELSFIILLEESCGNEKSYRALFQQSGYTQVKISIADSVQQATQMIQQNPPDVFFLGTVLPTFTEAEDYSPLLSAAKQIPIVILTVPEKLNLALELLRRGACDILIKDQFDQAQFLRVLQHCLETKQKHRAYLEKSQKLTMLSHLPRQVLWEWDLLTNRIERDETQFREAYELLSTEHVQDIDGWMDRIHPDDRQNVRAVIDAIFRHPAQNVFSVEYRLDKGDGTYVTLFDQGILLRDGNGKPLKILGAGQNITNWKKSEEKSRESEERFRLIFDNNPFPTLVFDAQTLQFLEVNKTAQNVYGYSREEFLKMTGKDIRPRKDIDGFLRDVNKTIKGKKPHKKVYTHLNKYGKKMTVEATTYLLDFFGKKAILSLINDITRETKLKEKLEREQGQRKKEVTKAIIKAEEKERTAIGIELHDNVNQLLASARLYNELALRGDGLQKEHAAKCIELIDYAISEIRKLSQALIAPNFNKTGLIAAIQDIASLLKMTKGLRVEINQDSLKESVLDQGQKLTLYRIVQEQINNILKHAHASLVQINLSCRNSEVTLTIIDNGRGFDPGVKRHGVGLANIENRASFYNGKMEIFSRPGQGTTLQVSFRIQT